MLTVKEWDEIRRAYHVEEKSIREIARETGHARRTVKRMVEAVFANVKRRHFGKK